MQRIAMFALFLVAGCHGLPDTRTAVEHEQLAAVSQSSSDQARAAVTVAETTRPVNNGVEATADATTPLYETAQGRSGYETMSAEDHIKIARKIRQNADVACARIPPSRWVTCPIGKPATVEAIPRGVRLILDGPAVELMRDQIDCALARARVERPSDADAAACPILVPGAHPRVIDRPEGPILEIVADDEVHAVDVRTRAERLRTR
jgi:hypothetical protein